MGVKGLSSLLEGPLSAAFACEPLPSGSVLLVDGNSWVWHLLRACDARAAAATGGEDAPDDAPTAACPRAHLGDYEARARARRPS